MLEDETRERLTGLLTDVPIFRAQGSPLDYLGALERALLFYPVFPDWRSPVDGWLDEAERLSRELGREATLGFVNIRRAVVAMRRADLAAALAQLEGMESMLPRLEPTHRAWHAITRARVLTRQRQLDAARAGLTAVDSGGSDDWLAPVQRLAEGELRIEEGHIDEGREVLLQAWSGLVPELVEERIAALQLLGFAAIAQADAPAALHWLDQARQMLRGAGAWPEVVQMSVATAAFLTAAGDQAAAQSLFEEALELCKAHPAPHLETLARLGLARSRAATGNVGDAVSAALRAATAFAEQGNLLGYVALIVLIANLFIQDHNPAEGYRTLATGLAIARKRGWTPVEGVMRAHIDHLRDQIMGPERFDEMVQAMIAEKKRNSLS